MTEPGVSVDPSLDRPNHVNDVFPPRGRRVARCTRPPSGLLCEDRRGSRTQARRYERAGLLLGLRGRSVRLGSPRDAGRIRTAHETAPRTRSQEVGGPSGVYSRLEGASTAMLLGERSRDDPPPPWSAPAAATAIGRRRSSPGEKPGTSTRRHSLIAEANDYRWNVLARQGRLKSSLRMAVPRREAYSGSVMVFE